MATDLVLTLTQILRARDTVGAFVEFHGPALDDMAVPDRATVANMAPEYGATCAYFPIDEQTLDYLRMTGRSEAHVRLVADYARREGLWREPGEPLAFTEELTFDLGSVRPSVSGPRRPQDLPAQLITPAGGRVLWLLDAAAAPLRRVMSSRRFIPSPRRPSVGWAAEQPRERPRRRQGA